MREGVGVLVTKSPLERTKDAFGGADVGVVDVSIDDVGADGIAVQRSAAAIGEVAQFLQRHPVVQIQCLLGGQSGIAVNHGIKEAAVEGVNGGSEFGGVFPHGP